MAVAANILAQTQGAISQQIRRPEEAMACQLFVRDRRALRLTVSPANAGGTVRVGVRCDLAGLRIAPLIRSLGERHPSVENVLVCAPLSDLLAALAGGDIDLAIVEEAVGPPADAFQAHRAPARAWTATGRRALHHHDKNVL